MPEGDEVVESETQPTVAVKDGEAGETGAVASPPDPKVSPPASDGELKDLIREQNELMREQTKVLNETAKKTSEVHDYLTAPLEEDDTEPANKPGDTEVSVVEPDPPPQPTDEPVTGDETKTDNRPRWKKMY